MNEWRRLAGTRAALAHSFVLQPWRAKSCFAEHEVILETFSDTFGEVTVGVDTQGPGPNEAQFVARPGTSSRERERQWRLVEKD